MHGGTGDADALQSPSRLLKTSALLKNVDVWTRRAQPSAVAPFTHSPTTVCIRWRILSMKCAHLKVQVITVHEMTPQPMVRYAFPLVFTAYVVAMHVGWGGYAPEEAA